MKEPELWERSIGSSQSEYRWMLYLDINVQQWFEDEGAARDAYDAAMRDWNYLRRVA